MNDDIWHTYESRITPETWARCYAWFCSVTKQRQVWDWPGPWPSLTSRCCVYCILSVMFHSISSSVSGFGLLREKVQNIQIVATAGSWQFTITLDIGGMKIRSVEIVRTLGWSNTVTTSPKITRDSIRFKQIPKIPKNLFKFIQREYLYHSVFISSPFQRK